MRQIVGVLLKTGGDDRNHSVQFSLDFPPSSNRLLSQRRERLDRGEPGAEVLGSEGPAARFPQILVDIVGIDAAAPVEQLLPPNFCASRWARQRA